MFVSSKNTVAVPPFVTEALTYPLACLAIAVASAFNTVPVPEKYTKSPADKASPAVAVIASCPKPVGIKVTSNLPLESNLGNSSAEPAPALVAIPEYSC